MDNINENKENIKTHYPIMLVHGTALSDRRNEKCWGRIPAKLKSHGLDVCFGKQDAFGSIPNNKMQLAKSIDESLKFFNADKINIIAHSKGGLDSRALVAMPDYTDKIASITTISTPHHGIGWLSKIWPFAGFFIAILSVILYPIFRIFYGDKRPRAYQLAKIMTCHGVEKFNLETPDQPNIFYQSYAGKMPPDSKSKLFSFTRFVANRYDGDNDGMISVESAKWGLFCGVITGGGKRGFSHADEIDVLKRNYNETEVLHDDNNSYSDVPQIYVRIVKDLKERGF